MYGSADLGAIAYESVAREGLIVDEGVIVEIVRPGTGDPVAASDAASGINNQIGQNPLFVDEATQNFRLSE
jgi:phenylacetate-CoA ligase